MTIWRDMKIQSLVLWETDQNEVGFCLKQEQISTSGVRKAILNAVKYNKRKKIILVKKMNKIKSWRAVPRPCFADSTTPHNPPDISDCPDGKEGH